MGLITTADLETYMEKTFTTEQTAKAQVLIDNVSAYITDYTGITFAAVTDDVIKVQASWDGTVVLPGIDIVEPTLIKSITQGTDIGGSTVSNGYIYWDGYDTLYNCYPFQWLEVTYSHGNNTIPQSIKGAVIEVCSDMLNNFKKLAAKTVGSTTEVYGYVTKQDIESYLSGLAMEALESYKDRETSFHIGPRTFPYE